MGISKKNLFTERIELMINFIICEDDKIMSKKVIDIVNDFMSKQEHNFNIGLIKDSTEGVIDYVKQNLNKKNIYILDIDLKDDKNGMKLAKEIRKYDYNGEIVFLTSHTEMVMYAFKYKLKALDFIDKGDNINERLRDNFKIILNKFFNNKGEYITVKCRNRIYKLNFDEIINIQTTKINGKLRVSMIDSQIEFYGKLKEIEIELDERFYRSHKCCIVNKDHIKIVNKENYNLYILMSNGEKSILSKNYIKGLMTENG